MSTIWPQMMPQNYRSPVHSVAQSWIRLAIFKLCPFNITANTTCSNITSNCNFANTTRAKETNHQHQKHTCDWIVKHMVVHRASQRAPEYADDLHSRLDKGRRNNHRTPQAQTRVLAQCRGVDNEKWKLLERWKDWSQVRCAEWPCGHWLGIWLNSTV